MTNFIAARELTDPTGVVTLRYILITLLLFYPAARTCSTHSLTGRLFQVWNAFGEEANASGVLLSNKGLSLTADATSVRVPDGKTLIIDGLFADTHKQLGGYYLPDCHDLTKRYGGRRRSPRSNRAPLRSARSIDGRSNPNAEPEMTAA